MTAPRDRPHAGNSPSSRRMVRRLLRRSVLLAAGLVGLLLIALSQLNTNFRCTPGWVTNRRMQIGTMGGLTEIRVVTGSARYPDPVWSAPSNAGAGRSSSTGWVWGSGLVVVWFESLPCGIILVLPAAAYLSRSVSCRLIAAWTRTPGACISCGYSGEGLPDRAPCPECGGARAPDS